MGVFCAYYAKEAQPFNSKKCTVVLLTRAHWVKKFGTAEFVALTLNCVCIWKRSLGNRGNTVIFSTESVFLVAFFVRRILVGLVLRVIAYLQC